jgi:hypothetical protein
LSLSTVFTVTVYVVVLVPAVTVIDEVAWIMLPLPTTAPSDAGWAVALVR